MCFSPVELRPPKNHQHLLLQFVTLRGLDEEALGDGGRCTGTWENRPPISHMRWIINGYTIQWLSNDYPEIDGIWTFENIPMLIKFLKRLQYILLQRDHMGMDQYLLIPFLMGWTSINPSYFDVNRRGTVGFDTLPYMVNIPLLIAGWWFWAKPLWKIWVSESQLGWWNSQLNGKS